MGKKRKPDEIPSPSHSEETLIPLQEEILQPPEIEEEQINQNLPLIPSDPNQDEEEQQQEEEVEEEEISPSSLPKLLEPFSKDQVIQILQNAASSHPDILASIKQIANHDPAHRKVFVHGLGWNATAETLIDVFKQFGEIEDCNAIVDKVTGRCKGYGFILFKNRSGATKALKEPQKKIGSKMTASQLASEGPPPAASANSPAFLYSPSPSSSSEYTQRKIYVSNVGADLDPNKVMQFFAKFGEIEEGPLGLDKASGKLRGFCLFVYRSVESARKALEEPHKNFEGHILHCQRAIDGPKISKYGGIQQGKMGVGGQGVQFGLNSVGGLSSGVGVAGPGHLIAPPAAGIRFNQVGQANPTIGIGYNPGLGLGVKHAGLAANSAFGNQVRAAGGYMKPGVVGGYGPSLRIPGSYGNVAMGQGNAWNQQG